jgi:uncharacterized membrane protein
MNKNRLDTFSDGVIAIIITITVLQLKLTNGNDLLSLIPFVTRWISISIYIIVTLIWLIPDSRIERIFEEERKKVT